MSTAENETIRDMASLTLSVSVCATRTVLTDWTNEFTSDHCLYGGKLGGEGDEGEGDGEIGS